MTGPTLRSAVETDFEAVLRVQAEAFGEYAGLYEISAWTQETVESLAQDARDKHLLVAEAAGVVVGSVRRVHVKSAHEQIATVSVRPLP